MNMPAVEELQSAAKAGDVAAMTALGIRLLGGRDAPLAPFDGAQLVVDAAGKGGAEAAEIVSVLAGAGACTPQSWPTAFDYLQLAAERGAERAKAQLTLLAGDRELATKAQNGAPADVWRCLRQSIDIASLTSAPPSRVLSVKPYLGTFENFISGPICDWLIERARPNLKPAQVYGDDTDAPRLVYARTNSSAEFDIVDADLVLLLVRARIAAAAGIPAAAFENTTILHYKVGEEFRRHYDFLDPNKPGEAADFAKRGQRVMTFLVYLNDAYEAGETEFPLINMRYKGQKGGAIQFRNIEPSGAPDRQTLHAGLAPTRGEKWLLSQWIRDPRMASG